MNCNHTAFNAATNVNRNIDSVSGKLTLSASFRIRCTECDTEFAIDPSSLEVSEFGLRGQVRLLLPNEDEPVIRGTATPAEQTLEELLARVGLSSPETSET